jgi:hypothetical protein
MKREQAKQLVKAAIKTLGGYTGMKSWVESDYAADLMNDCLNATVPVLQKGLKEESNEFNTSGPVNVLLVIMGLVKTHHDFSREMEKVFYQALEAVKKESASAKTSKEASREYKTGLANLIKKAQAF